jgi:Zn-dependent protease
VLVFRVRWATAVAVTSVLLLHELGHALAMRLVGLRVRGFVFVPLFGAATLPEHSFSSRWDEARVALAGPASGLPTAGAIVLLVVAGPEQYRGVLGVALLWALGVNVLNLIPVLPLDGGRMLATLTASLPPLARAAFAYVPIAVLTLLAVVLLQGNALLGALVFLGFAVSLTRITLRRQAFLGWMERLPQPLGAVRASLRDVTHAFSAGAREDVDGGVAVTPLTSAQVVLVVVAYVAVAGVLLAGAVAFLATCPWVLDDLKGGG